MFRLDDYWVNMRRTLSPVFTGSKMRLMFDLINKCGSNFVTYLKQNDTKQIEMNDIFKRLTTNAIASTAFGVECDALNNPKDDFIVMGREIGDLTGWKAFKLLVYGVPKWILTVCINL